jgi:hypothetical protein
MGLSRYLLALAFCLTSSLSAATIHYGAVLTGDAENSPVVTTGTGSVNITIDDVANTIHIQVVFSGLGSIVIGGNLHCCIAPGQTASLTALTPILPGFPTGVTSGGFDATFDLLDPATYNPMLVNVNGGSAEGARLALLTGLAQGRGYFNIRTSVYVAGEIRGNLVETTESTVPEPGTFGLAAAGLLLVAKRFRRV